VEKWDVVVVGSSPAGSMTAMKAAEGGAKTLVLERQKLPRFKLCGGGVASWVIKKLRVPESVIDREYKVLEYYAPPDYKALRLPIPASYYGVYRDRFDRFLLSLAEEAGATVREKVKVVDVVMEEGWVKGVVTGNGEKIMSDVVVACDGALSTVARKSGFWDVWFTSKGENWREHMSFCVGVEVEMDDEVIDERFGDSYLFFTGEDVAPIGYAWIFPKKGRLSVGLGSLVETFKEKPKEYITRFIREHPVASKLLEGGRPSPVKGAYIPTSHPYKPSYGAGVLFAGDSAGMVSPITGEGRFYAVRAGMDAGVTAAEAVSEGDFSAEFLSRYEERWEEHIGKHLDFQAELFREAVGKIREGGDFGAELINAFARLIQYLSEYASKKRK